MCKSCKSCKCVNRVNDVNHVNDVNGVNSVNLGASMNFFAKILDKGVSLVIYLQHKSSIN